MKRILGRPDIDLRNKLIFKEQGAGNYNCKLISDNIISNYLGFKSEGAGYLFQKNGSCAFYQLALENPTMDDWVFYEDKVKEGMEYLNLSLELGYPIVVGVNHTFRKNKIDAKKNHNESTTDHFVVIVGRFFENGTTYYRYWDVATINGAKNDYKFEKNENGHLIDPNAYGSKKYTLTQIRRFNNNGAVTLTTLKTWSPKE